MNVTEPGAEQVERLRSIILAQSAETIGAPVLLFGDPAAAAAAADDQDLERLRTLMVELAIDPEDLELFGTDAYVLQTALAAQLLDDHG